MRIIFVRHAESANNLFLNLPSEEYFKTRKSDPDITDLGIKQCMSVGKFLANKKHWKIQKVFCSPMLRAIRTAEIISKSLDIPYEMDLNVHEKGGCYEGESVFAGNPRSFYEKEFPLMILPKELDENGWWGSKPKETREEALTRAAKLIDYFYELAKDEGTKYPDKASTFIIGKDKCYLVITHGAFLDLLLGILTNREKSGGFVFDHLNTGMTSVTFFSDRTHVIDFLNFAEHLDEALNEVTMELSPA